MNRGLTNVTTALDRCFTAFETGTLDTATCGQRVRALVEHAGRPVQRKAVIETHITEVRIEHGALTPVFKLPPALPPG